MTHSPVVSFGLCATAAAMNAKCKRFELRDRYELALAALRLVPHDATACQAVSVFLMTVDVDSTAAGAQLQRFVSSWLEQVAARDSQDVEPDSRGDGTFAWQNRADLQ